MRKKQKGFSLIELLIVVTIILIIAAMAIPNLMRQRMHANEAAAIAALRTITSSLIMYSSTYPQVGFAKSLSDLGGDGSGPTGAGLIDEVIAKGAKQGYDFTYKAGQPDSNGHINTYEINADPSSRGSTGQRSFYTDQSGSIRSNPSSSATLVDPII